jgi:hypothetical protein
MSEWQRGSGSVQGRDLEPAPPAREVAGRPKAAAQTFDWSEALGMAGVVLVVGSLGLIVWAINGGYSVEGLPVLAALFNDVGAAFYAALSQVTFAVPYFGGQQPLFPWAFVIGTTCVQIVAIYRTLQNQSQGPIFWLVAAGASLYDYITTFLGLDSEPWLASAPDLVPGILALVLTFIVETVVSFLVWTFTGRRRYRRRH